MLHRVLIALSWLSLLVHALEDTHALVRGGSTSAHREAMENQENHISSGQRRLTLPSVPCGSTPGKIHLFEVHVSLKAEIGYDLSGCTSTKKQQLGDAINGLLIDYGVGTPGAGDNGAFVAEVCNDPDRRRRLNGVSFTFNGGGKCRFCNQDNFDARRLDSSSDDDNWFANAYMPAMETMLVNTLQNSIVGNHVACLGSTPDNVAVNLKEIYVEPITDCD